MGWIEPKTDWEKDDYFNIDDYNRIKNNIKYLWEISVKLYKDFTIGDMGPNKTYYEYPYADEFNTIGDNLEKIINNTYPLNIGGKSVYEENHEFIGWEDLNRIESACLKMFRFLEEQKSNKIRFKLRLGNMKGVKC